MNRYFIYLSYKGTVYHGWQIQQNATSVQDTLQKSLSKILQEKIEVVGAGRTDTGVHASYYVAHFESDVTRDVTSWDFVYHLNAVLPRDIAVQSIKLVDSYMHARFSAVEREYKYYISKVKNPFTIETTYQYVASLDVDKMQEAAKILLKHSDFTSFAKLHADTKTNICSVTFADFECKGDMIIFTIRADRFLRNMVRAIVGTLMDVGKGLRSVEDFDAIILAKDRCAASRSAHARALYLTDIKY
ncbi:MAG: tRNA pseudouridine(38-40) synthase TruA [Bacteroidetes bacterium]|nr:tRNA pseudouridine(38-40) synthase TruA [Bacteroidota bacterium]